MKVKVVTIALALLVIMIIAPTTLVNADHDELYSSMWDKGVVVVLYGNQYGTAWWVERTHLVTAAHVVNYQSNVRVTLIHGDYQSLGTVIYVDNLHDVAVIRADEPPAYQYIWYLSRTEPEKGETIFVVGYPYELYKITGDIGVMSANPRVAEGIVAWVYPDKQLFEFQASTDQGNSGGPIVDAQGNVLGLVSFALEGTAANMYYGTSISAIKEALSKVGVSYKTGLSSLLDTASSESILTPTLVAVVLGIGASIVTTAVMVPALRSRRR